MEIKCHSRIELKFRFIIVYIQPYPKFGSSCNIIPNKSVLVIAQILITNHRKPNYQLLVSESQSFVCLISECQVIIDVILVSDNGRHI